MIKELKYLFFIIIILLVIFLTLNFYFSDINKKNSYRSLSNSDRIVLDYSKNLKILSNNTINIIEYIKKNENKDKKNFNFWKLINNDK
jgi:hypothetical protein|tara:strand:+ start:1399 stop:1662 length:264 start_codon:yes stop_codon:yes gene_type:complete